jgi:hypothetical protein
VTAWNNHLAGLAAIGVLIEIPQGRAKRYRPIAQEGCTTMGVEFPQKTAHTIKVACDKALEEPACADLFTRRMA